jgi:hypothetical protein
MVKNMARANFFTKTVIIIREILRKENEMVLVNYLLMAKNTRVIF